MKNLAYLNVYCSNRRHGKCRMKFAGFDLLQNAKYKCRCGKIRRYRIVRGRIARVS